MQSRKHVLIAEDDSGMRAILRGLLRKIDGNIEIDEVVTADAALVNIEDRRQVLMENYDLIIADIFTPGGSNGLDLWRHCRVKCPEISILFISSMAVEQFFGFVASSEISPPYLPKPFSVGECSDAIRMLLHYDVRPAACSVTEVTYG